MRDDLSFPTLRAATPPSSSGDDAARRPALAGRHHTVPEAPSSKRSWSKQGIAVERGPVLIVGHDRFAVGSLARALIRDGYSVRLATDAAELVTATSSGTPCALVLPERVAADMPRPLAALLRDGNEVAVVVHGCARTVVAEATLRALGAKRVIGIEGSAGADVVTVLAMLVPA